MNCEEGENCRARRCASDAAENAGVAVDEEEDVDGFEGEDNGVVSLGAGDTAGVIGNADDPIALPVAAVVDVEEEVFVLPLGARFVANQR